MKSIHLALSLLLAASLTARAAEGGAPSPALDSLTKPLALVDCLEIALKQNSAIRKSQADIEASHGVIIQTRAIVMPKVLASGNFTANDETAVDQFPGAVGNVLTLTDQQWNAGIQVVQSIYEGGRMRSALRSARFTREQALAQHNAVVARTVLEVRLAYYDGLLAAQHIVVQEASQNLLQKELDDQQRRYDAGTVPRFNVLRAEVELANARPKLIRARNAQRIAKNNLANLLGYTLPRDVPEDIPVTLSGTLKEEPWNMELAAAITQALQRRPELEALRQAEDLRREAIKVAKAGRLPSVQVFAGWGWRNSMFTDDLTDDLSGWSTGARFSWSIFDGQSTRGRVVEARALLQKVEEESTEAARNIERDVRTAHSNVVEAREVLESTRKVQEQAEEALRLATARSEAGTGTQLDVLNAQTALTEARTIQIQALRDAAAARARLEHAIGQDLQMTRLP